MTPYSVIFPLAVFFTTLLASHFLVKVFGVPSDIHRQSPLDGLRGVLAFGVFLCHAGVWHNYINTGAFETPGIGPFNQLGKSGVYMFFMITGFLFMSKLINERDKGVDWTRLFVSRVLRLTPLYLTVMILMIFLVLIESNFQLQVTWGGFLTGIARWLTFTVFGEPVLNGYDQTPIITSHVQWTLVYEWLLYLSLPLLALVLKIRVPLLYLVASVALVSLFIVNMQGLFFPVAFLAGILTAMIFRFGRIKLLLAHPAFSVVAITLVFWQAWHYSGHLYQQPTRIPALCLSIAFLIIACGNNLFGFLSSKATRYLGEISYGIYLLHGVILFCVFKYAVGFEQLKTLSATDYWTIIYVVAMLILMAATFTYRAIEAPAMRQVSAVRSRLKTVFGI